MEVLLTIAALEEGGDEGCSWSPYRNPAAELSPDLNHFAPGRGPPRPTAAQIASGYRGKSSGRLTTAAHTVTGTRED